MKGRVVFAPVLHGRLAFALAVRDVFLRERPDCVAVELPETLSAAVERAVRRLPLLSVIRYEESSGTPAYLLVEPCDPVFEALRCAHEHGITAHLIDRDTEGYAATEDAVPDPYAVERIGYERYVREVASSLVSEGAASGADDLREATMAYHVADLAERHDNVLVVCGLAHVERIRKRLEGPVARPLGRTRREGVTVHHLHPDSSREVLSEPGRWQGLFEKWRSEFSDASLPSGTSDRYRLVRELLLDARERMKKEDGEIVPARGLRIATQFARNQAIVRGGLAPDLYEVTVGARGVASDDFAWHVWDLGVTYPHQTDTPDLSVLRVTLEDLDRGSRRVWFRRRQKTRRHLLRLMRSREREPRAGAWAPPEGAPSICSYPPEDIRIEAYGHFLKKRAKGLLAAEHAHVVPMLSGMGDGIDLRETIRALGRDGRIRIREEQVARGDVGAVCVIFDARDQENRYPWKMTWQGEHDEESDMALYATPPDQHVVGPGIARCEYGGFLMTYPPGRMFRVFEDEYFDSAETKAERLLLAAIDYAAEPWIVYVAARPPVPKMVSLARRAGKKIMFIPIGQLSPEQLRNIRVFHVLDGRKARASARKYVGF